MQGEISGWVSYVFNGSQLVCLLAAIAIGGRLFHLHLRTREPPELLLGIQFVVGQGIGYVVLVAGITAISKPGADIETCTAMVAGGWALVTFGLMAMVSFNYFVYRQDSAWGLPLMFGFWALFWVGYLARGWIGQYSDPKQFEGVWFALHQGTTLAAGIWSLAEPIRFHGLMKKRLALGLADPMVTNRFLLWGSAAIFSCMMIAMSITPAFYSRLDPSLVPIVSTGTLILMTVCGTCAMGLYGLTFFPPRAYAAWVTKRASRVPVPHPEPLAHAMRKRSEAEGV
jgi:hypothetical protein